MEGDSTITVCDEVIVVENFLANSQPEVELKVGSRGQIVKFSSCGSLLVDFETHPQLLWTWPKDRKHLEIRGQFDTRPEAVAIAAMPNPGICLTPKDLADRWLCYVTPQRVTAFLGQSERDAKTEVRCFSNFYDEAGFDFDLPATFCAEGFELSSNARRVHCQFSEKAIMLCKAAVMGDRMNWDLIKATRKPVRAKKVGRNVRPWDAERWTSMVCAVAFEVVYQKFAKIPEIRPALLATGDSFIVEAKKDDPVWGIGLGKGDNTISIPAQWKGTNVLGWALMTTREMLKASPVLE